LRILSVLSGPADGLCAVEVHKYIFHAFYGGCLYAATVRFDDPPPLVGAARGGIADEMPYSINGTVERTHRRRFIRNLPCNVLYL
jgi:hypothetical protein